MSPLVPLALIGWIPFVWLFFIIMPARRAIITSYLGAWMFLPVFGYNLAYWPTYTKVTAANIAVLIAAILFDSKPLRNLRPSWFDIPFAVYCIVPFFASMANDLGSYDGGSGVLKRVVSWGIPYLIGRAYFTSLPAARDIAIGVVIGALVYTPLCLWEVRMSPILHQLVYGFRPDPFYHAVRYGGYRPTVFMHTGLMVGMWMATATVLAFWLWRKQVVAKIMGIPVSLITGLLFFTTVLCKSTYSIFLAIVGAVAVFTSARIRTSLPVVFLVLVPSVYMITRTTDMLPQEPLVQFATLIANEDRANSLASRLTQEKFFTEKALEKPVFGWAGYNRFKPDEEDWGRGVDAMWLTTFGMTGLTGLIALNIAWMLPAVLMMSIYPVRTWSVPMVAPAIGLMIIFILTMCDNLLNSMYNPIMTVIAGSLSSIANQQRTHTLRQFIP